MSLLEQFKPFKPNIKIQILICYPQTFPVEVVGRIFLFKVVL